MICLICNELAVDVNAGDYFQERNCLECGRYRVTGSALELLKKHGWRFDTQQARKWIEEHQGSATIPIIDSQQAARLIDV